MTSYKRLLLVVDVIDQKWLKIDVIMSSSDVILLLGLFFISMFISILIYVSLARIDSQILYLTLPRHTFFFNQIRHYGSMWPETNFDCSPFSHECTDRPVKILTYILDILKRYPMIKKILKIINMLNKIREKNFFFEKMMFYEKICIFLNF